MHESGFIKAIGKNTEFAGVPVDDCVVPDHTGVFSYPRLDDRLIESIERLGVLHPLLVSQNSGGGFSVICGVKRLFASRQLKMATIPALVISGGISERDQFEAAFAENRTVRGFNTVECAGILWTLSSKFSMDPEYIDENYIPALGISGGRSNIRNYCAVYDIEDAIKHFLVQWNIPVSTAVRFLNFSGEDRKIIFDKISGIHIHGGKLKQFLTLCYEIMCAENCSAASLFDNSAEKEIFLNEATTYTQKQQKILAWLQERRYPKLTELTDIFSSIAESLKNLPPETIRPPAYFEGDKLTATFTFKNMKEFGALSKALNNRENNLVIQRLLKLL